ncbi:MAG TPA: LPS export ABC transporter periplasmic protein LptC [Candidatus Angelobacter sp.]|nr:LPS export ABC transporter periplasmic protein LptC [Candidatus Angelobacter sp.]
MAFDPKRLQRYFAAGAMLVVVIAVGFYLRGIFKPKENIPDAPNNIASNVEKSATGFNLSKSKDGKMLFTIHANSVQQYKESGKAALHDVSIIVFGRNQDRSDQIYGSDFAYDPVAKEVTAQGQVRIDLEANSTAASSSGQTPASESRNLIHVTTSGLTFNENTGIAQTRAAIEFRVPEGNGSAVGAMYDSHGGTLTLKSAVRVTSTGARKATITGQSAIITKSPSKIVLQSARVEQPERTISADKVTVFLRDDNNIDRIVGSGNLHATKTGAKGFEVSAPEGELEMAGANQARAGSLSGGVTFASKGDTPAEGRAGKMLLTFGVANRVTKARAENTVQLQQGAPGKSQELHAVAVDLFVKDGKKLEKAVTSSGPAEIVRDQGTGKTTISAGRFETTFNQQNRPVSLYGTPDAKIVDSVPGKPDRILMSRELTAKFNEKGEIVSADQTGDFHYEEGTQKASAERAKYGAVEETIVLSGSPRVLDSGVTLTADSIQLNRKTRNAFAQDNVKTTYSNITAQPSGAMLASADPIHVTGTTVTLNAATGVARYSKARLWQGANIVEAPTISFDRTKRSLQAQGSQAGQVASVFVQKDKNGKLTPVNVTSDKLSYVDSERKAIFSGNVIVRTQETTITSDTVQVILLPRKNQAENQSASQLERIEAQGDIKIQQGARKAAGTKLVYTAADEKMVLTGTLSQPPSIFDAEQGQISGDSLTFFTHDGRVLVGGGETSQTQIPGRIRDASKK